MPDISRRRVLGTVAAGSALSVLPPSLLQAMAAPMPRGGLRGIEHVIVLMQENRSFDSYFGTLRGVRGYGDRTALRLPDGASVFEQPRSAGPAVLPFSARKAAVDAGRPEGDIQYLGSLPHGFADGVQARANGWWNDWIAAKGQSTMAYYDRRDIPLQYELADRFTICDAYFCSVFGSTNPNRNYLWTGTTGFEPNGGGRAVTNAAYSYTHAGYDWTTYPERLEAAGISWQIYQEWDNFTDNAVEYFKPWKRIGRKILDAAGFPYATTEEFYDKLWARSPAEREAALARFRTGVNSLTGQERRLFQRGAHRSEPGTLLSRIRTDIRNGTLPKVSWVVPTAALSEHPGASTPAGSAGLVYGLLDAIASDPKTWSRTALFINFDENDGYFDHVPSPTAPRPESGSGDDWVGGRPVGPGPRVPMTVVSPWTVGGFVASEVFDHTSVIRFLEKWTGVHEPNISAWRRSVFGDLTSVFDFDRAHRQPEVARPGPVPPPIGRWNPVPPAQQALPAQETGVRPTRPSPYLLSLRADVTETGVSLDIGNLHRSRAAAVTAYGADGTAPRTWTVAGREAATGTFPQGPDGYDLQVHGPGWSRWELRGSGVGAEAHAVERVGARSVRITCSNPSARTRTLLIGETTYQRRGQERIRTVRLAPGRKRTVTVPLAEHGWYDIVVLDESDPRFLRRMTGRAAEGDRATTDPATGTAPALAATITLPEPLPPLKAPLVQGSPAEVAVRIRNQGRGRLRDPEVYLVAPDGWTVEPVKAAPRTLPEGGSAELRFTVTPPVGATAATLIATARAEGSGLLRIADARIRAEVAPAVSMELTAPASSPGTDGCVLSPDKPLTVTATVTNAGSTPLTDLAGALAVPPGWKAAQAPGAPASIPARASADIVWEVVAPAAAARTSATLEATVGARSGRGRVEQTGSLAARVGPVMTGYLLAEDFESLAGHLAPASDLSRPGLTGWTRTAPEGWTVTNAPGMPQGTKELNGWSFLSRQFWFPAGQERAAFQRALGIIAVADPDDWDDTGNPAARGRFDSTLTTPAITIPADTPTLHLGFDSHYRQESPQEAEVTVAFDTGASSRVLNYSSAASGNTNAGRDQQNRLVTCSFPVPSGATSVKVGFRVHNAGNNWYWAVDNIRLGSSPVTDS